MGPAKSKLNMRPPVTTRNDPHLEVILACLLYLGHGRHIPKIRLYPDASAGAGGALRVVGLVGMGRSELLFRFKVFHKLTNTVLGQTTFASKLLLLESL